MNLKKLVQSLAVLVGVTLVISCGSESASGTGDSTPKTLPFIGERDIDPATGDTIYASIRDFEFLNQDSQVVSNATFENKAYVVDFFFISCPTICPKLKQQMLRIHERFESNADLLMLSHTVDTKHDTIPRLKKYADNLGVSSQKWHFVTGEKDSIYNIANDYFSVAIENADAPGGYDHSGRIILVDENRHVRAFCNGTDPGEVDAFMDQIDVLLSEQSEE